MNYSCLPVSLFPEITNSSVTIKEWASFAKQNGLTAIDLSVLLLQNHTPVYIEKIRRDLEDVGIEIAMLTDYPDFTHPDQLQREREFAYFSRDIALASQLGAQYVRVTAGQKHPGLSRAESVSLAIEHIKRSTEIADRMGIKLVLENHYKPGAWMYMDFGATVDVFLELMDSLKEYGVGVNFDTANAVVIGGDPIGLLREVLDSVVTVHVADTTVNDELVPSIIGTGVVPFTEMFSLLKGHGSVQYLCIEEWSQKGFKGIAQSIKNTIDLWESAPTF